MTWVKRNLYFLIACAVAVGLMGWAGWNLWVEWGHNEDILTKLDEQYGKLTNLNNQKPQPGTPGGKVDNIKTAQDQRKQLQGLLAQGTNFFQRILPIPNPESGRVTERDFSATLSRVIDQMQRDATNASVIIPPNYAFSFAAERSKVSFATNGLAPLSVELGEVKAICEVLFQAKINMLENLRREPDSPDDQAGLQTDYLGLEDKSITNDLAILTPYEITFLSFSSELASVLGGFAASPYGFVVKTVNVDPASSGALDLTPMDPGSAPPVRYAPPPTFVPPTPSQSADPYSSGRYGTPSVPDRYGSGPAPGGVPYRGLKGGSPTPPPAYNPAAAAAPAAVAGSRGPQIVLDEKLLKITITLDIVKLLSNEPKAAPAASKGRGPVAGAAPGAAAPGAAEVKPLAEGPATTPRPQ
ncbi:MAG: hypothetical protein C5B50_21750 [Verrucomicrobia bacterium]|nr:MAG: hypothetical protein C5B50_21750 [Verrucomicrobiota bacterium]